MREGYAGPTIIYMPSLHLFRVVEMPRGYAPLPACSRRAPAAADP